MPLSSAGTVGVAHWQRAYRPEGAVPGETRQAAKADESGPTEAEHGAQDAENGTAPRELSKGRLLDIYG